MSTTIIDLIRHGEPEGGRAYRGNTIDDSLSEKGWQQMWDAIGNSVPWQTIISSPMKRCQAFSIALADKNNLVVSTVESFKEVGFGEWEGRTPVQIKSENMQQFTDFYQDPVHLRPPGAEPLDKFISRVSTAYDRVVSDNRGKHILIVAHAGVIRAILTHVLNAPAKSMYHIKIKTAGISRILDDDLNTQIEFINNKL
jgi:probable phosphoglycerate mutase